MLGGGRPLAGLPVILIAIAGGAAAAGARSVAWNDLTAAARTRLEATGLTETAFPAFLDRLRRAHGQRIREGDLDHLVFYLLQSTHFTKRPPIEPALSARAFVDALPEPERRTFLERHTVDPARVPADVRARAKDLAHALGPNRRRDLRLSYFRALAGVAFAGTKDADREAALLREYVRVMWFVYEKEFVAQRSAAPADAVAELYRSRGLSTDTAVEAGYLVYQGLGVVKALNAERRIRRVLIVGPGLDLAPRTGLLEESEPESYQPWAVIDALLSLGLARSGDLEVVGADINPRVIYRLREAKKHPPVLRLVSGITENGVVAFTADYRDYFARLGGSIGRERDAARPVDGHLAKTVTVDAASARALSAAALDVVIDRLEPGGFDLVIATNILPYFDDVELMLAVSNIAAMLAPGGVFLHNEARPAMGDVASAAGLTFMQARQATIATVTGAPPLADSVWVLRKSIGTGR